MPLTQNDIEAELSYAYLHAVAASAGFSCQQAARTVDAFGVDAEVRAKERFAPDSVLTDIALDVQLKATCQQVPLVDEKYRYPLPVSNYDSLRGGRSGPAIFVLLLLPEDHAEWLVHTEDQLMARRCAYWVSLKGAPATQNEATRTVHVPKANALSPASLRELFTSLSRQVEPLYAP